MDYAVCFQNQKFIQTAMINPCESIIALLFRASLQLYAISTLKALLSSFNSDDKTTLYPPKSKQITGAKIIFSPLYSCSERQQTKTLEAQQFLTFLPQSHSRLLTPAVTKILVDVGRIGKRIQPFCTRKLGSGFLKRLPIIVRFWPSNPAVKCV